MKTLNLLLTAAANVMRQRLRTFVVIICLIVILLPFLTATAIQEGVKEQALLSVSEGADVYVTMDMYGRNGMIPVEMAGEIEKIEGVTKAVPRVISRIYIEGRLAVLLGLPLAELEEKVGFIKGSAPGEGETVIGRGLADALGLDVGGSIGLGVRVTAIVDHRPYIERRIYRISGIFDSAGIWTSDLVLVDIEDAISIYEMEGFVSDIAVYVRPGYERSVTEEIQKINSYFRIQTKALAERYMEQGFNRKGGVFVSLYVMALGLAIPTILVLSGFGLSERRREVGILKATGWQTQEVLEMVFFENIIIAVIGASLALLLSYIWVRVLNGLLIAQIFIAEVGNVAPFKVPALFTPMPFVLSFILALVLTMTGSIYSTWRTSIVPPAEAMR